MDNLLDQLYHAYIMNQIKNAALCCIMHVRPQSVFLQNNSIVFNILTAKYIALCTGTFDTIWLI